MKKTLIRIAALLCCSGVLYAEETDVHLVKRGETFSKIAKKHLGKPVYRLRTGSLARLLHLNPQIGDPNLLQPGDKIFLKEQERQPASDSALPLAEENAKQLPSLEDATTKAIKSQNDTDQSPKHRLNTSAAYSMSSIGLVDRSTGAEAKLFTSRDASLRVAWAQEWSERFSTHAAFKFRTLKFEPSTNATKSISGDSKSQTELEVGGKHKLSSRLSLQGAASYGQETFVRGVSSSTLTIDSVPVPKFTLGIGLDAFRQGNTTAGINLSGSYVGGATTDAYSIDSGKAFEAGAFLKTNFSENRTLALGLGYRRRDQNTSTIEVHETGVFGTVTLSFPFLGGGK